jgi:hypothetical protein
MNELIKPAAMWNPASQPPENKDGMWSRPVIAITVDGEVHRISAMGGYWQRTQKMADSGIGGTVIAWTDFPDLSKYMGS